MSKIHLRGRPHGMTLCGLRWAPFDPAGERHDVDAVSWTRRNVADCKTCQELATNLIGGVDDASDARLAKFTRSKP